MDVYSAFSEKMAGGTNARHTDFTFNGPTFSNIHEIYKDEKKIKNCIINH